jgi:LmbE family N-acetylglucosaminyl deacetylase
VPSILDPRVCEGSHEGLLACYSLSKQSNLAGYRAAFVAGDPALVGRLLELRKHAGMIVPWPVQEAMRVALGDDGHVADADPSDLALRIRAIMAEERPDVVYTFGPDGITGHPDHIAVGQAADAAFLGLASDGGPGFRRLLHWAVKHSSWLTMNRARLRLGLPPWDPKEVYHFRGVPDDLIDMRVDTRTVAGRVVAGVVEHRSQQLSLMAPPAGLDAWHSIAAREYFVQAWPPRERGMPLLRDIFEGL